jgi:NADH:ubiquinone oxidoreductase subunit E
MKWNLKHKRCKGQKQVTSESQTYQLEIKRDEKREENITLLKDLQKMKVYVDEKTLMQRRFTEQLICPHVTPTQELKRHPSML